VSPPEPLPTAHPSSQANPADGERLVVYEVWVSCVVFTWRWTPPPVRTRPGWRAILRGLPYALVSLALGWWGLPWGVVGTPAVVLLTLAGGRDITVSARPSPLIERCPAG